MSVVPPCLFRWDSHLAMSVVPGAQKYLRNDINFEALDKEAMLMTDLESAKQMQEQKSILFRKIFAAGKNEL